MVDPAGVSSSLESERSSKAGRVGIRGRLIAACALLTLTTLVSGSVALLSYREIAAGFSDVTSEGVVMTDALQLAVESATLSALAPNLAASSSQEERAVVAERITTRQQAVEAAVAALRDRAEPDLLNQIVDIDHRLNTALGELDRKVQAQHQSANERVRLLALTSERHRMILDRLQPLIEDANAALVRRTAETSEVLAGTLNDLMNRGVQRLRSALEAQVEVNRLSGLLIEVSFAPNAGVVASIRDRFITVQQHLLEVGPDLDDVEGLMPVIEQMIALGTGPRNFFERRERQLGSQGLANRRAPLLNVTDRALALQHQALELLVPVVDDANFELLVAADDAISTNNESVGQLIESSVGALRSYLEIIADTNLAVGLLTLSANQLDPAAIPELRQTFESAASRLSQSLAHLSATGTESGEIAGMVDELLEIGAGERSIFDLRLQELRRDLEQRQLAKDVGALSESLGAEVEKLVVNLEQSVQTRAQNVAMKIQMSELWLLGLCGASVLIALLLVVLYIGPCIVKPLRRLTAAVDRLAAGEAVEVPGIQRSDELGALARALSQIYDRGVESARIHHALDSSSAMVMIADKEDQIIFVNEALRRHLAEAALEMRRTLADFDPDQLIGARLQTFAQPDAAQRSDGAPSPVEFGQLKFQLSSRPVVDAAGEPLGTVVEWRDLTVDLRLQHEMDALVGAAVNGDFSRRVSSEGTEGMLAEMSRKLNRLAATVEETMDDFGHMLAAMAQGRLAHRITKTYGGKFGELKENANTTAARLADIVAEIREASTAVEAAVAEIVAGAEDLARRTEQASSTIEETAASTEEMSATVKQNARNAENATKLAESANQVAGKGGTIVASAVGAMAEIETSSQKIADIIGVIDEIAFQTNLLALNASVEAARAGEAGKGFAVVASEVRALAQRSAQAAGDIKALIQDSGIQVKEGVQLVNQAGGTLEEIVGAIRQVANMIDNISTASREQAAGVDEINVSVTQMDEMTQQNSALVEESAAAARSLGEQAEKLASMMAFFNLGDEGLRRAPGERSGSRRPPPSPAGRPTSKFSKQVSVMT